MKSPSLESSSLPIGVSREIGNWADLAIEKLEHFPLIQPYSALINLESNGEFPTEPLKHIRRPIGNPDVFSTLPIDALRHEFKGKGAACGYAWAARKELIRKHGLYDACIIGSGDRAIFCAAIGVSGIGQARGCWNHFERCVIRR